jgi:hypothetical protein
MILPRTKTYTAQSDPGNLYRLPSPPLTPVFSALPIAVPYTKYANRPPVYVVSMVLGKLTFPDDFLLCSPACDQEALFLAPINGHGY